MEEFPVQPSRRSLVIVCFLLLVTAFASADQIAANFTLNPGLQTVPSQGTITFQLTQNGAIDASLTITNGLDIMGFAFASVQKDLLLTNFAPTSPIYISSAQTGFGTFNTGFVCPCGTSETFTIGTQGQFSSVFQALGGSGVTVDFVLIDSQGFEWGADAVGNSPVPEPSSLMLLGAGTLAGLGPLRRRTDSSRRQELASDSA
jgi:PEP-CTERM motif